MSLGLIGAACNRQDDGDSGGGTEDTVDGGTEGTDGGTAETTPIATDPPITEPAVEVVEGGKLVIAGEAEVANPWTPAAMQCDSFCQMRARTFFDPLVVVDNDLNWRPYLAESIEANADSTVFTVKLRSGVKFHDGTDLNADAAIKSFSAAMGGLIAGNALKDVARDPSCYNAAAGILGNLACPPLTEKVDDLTFTIATGKSGDAATPVPWPLFPYYLGGQVAFIASPTWLDAVAANPDVADEPVGTGPFVFSEYAPGEGGKLVVTKNPNYWLKDAEGRNLPYLDELEFRVISDSQVRASALEAGDVDMIATSDGAVVSDFEGNEEFPTILQQEYGETNYILIHLSKPGPLQSKEVRCALAQGLDKVDIIDVIANGFLDPAAGLFSPGQEGFLEAADSGVLPYDPEAAAAAIAEYEAANGEITINYSTTTAATSLATAEYLQSVWGEIGVDVEITQIEQSKLINNALFGDPAFEMFGWRNHAGLFVDQQYFWWHTSAALPDGQLALNFGRLSDPVIDEALDNARSEADPEVRRGYAEEVNRRLNEECYVIPTSYTKWGVIHNQRVAGVGTLPQPDGQGGFVRDGAGFPGQVWLTSVFAAS